MTLISEKNTKAEILAAYQTVTTEKGALEELLTKKEKELQGKIDELTKLSSADVPEEQSKGVYGDDLLKIESLTNEKDRLLGVIQDMNDQKVTVVIPYVGKFAQGNELLLALRGWEENFKENFNVVIIGSGVPKLSEEVHIIECGVVGSNPPIDIAHKMLKVIDSEFVTDKFIWANDDQYLISPCMLADFEILKCTGKLGEKHFGSAPYQINKKRTFELLKKEGKGTWDFSSHTPFVFEKQKLQDLISEFNLTKEAHLIATLYHNWYFKGFVPLNVDSDHALSNDNIKVGVYRQNADFNRLKVLMPKKKLINNSQSGWSSKLVEVLNARFPKKCRFEA